MKTKEDVQLHIDRIVSKLNNLSSEELDIIESKLSSLVPDVVKKSRPFIQISEDTIKFDNGTVMKFEDHTCWLNGNTVTVQEWMTYLLSDQYLKDNNLDE